MVWTSLWLKSRVKNRALSTITFQRIESRKFPKYSLDPEGAIFFLKFRVIYLVPLQCKTVLHLEWLLFTQYLNNIYIFFILHHMRCDQGGEIVLHCGRSSRRQWYFNTDERLGGGLSIQPAEGCFFVFLFWLFIYRTTCDD